MELVIMAAGMGSRFGGLKQIEPMGPNGEFIIDYSIYDAIKAGFNRVVFIIKKENAEVFKETIGKRVEGHIAVSYVYQDMDDIPSKYIGTNREKPWGTAHAIYCCRNIVKEPFAIINADDFYGEDAYKKAAEFLTKEAKGTNFGMVGYRVVNTLTENGSVKRGICSSENGYLTSLIESKVERKNGVIEASPLSGAETFTVSDNALVSMNMFLFTPDIFGILENDIVTYFQKHESNLNEGEFLVPDVVFDHLGKKDITVKVLDTSSVWYGVTYREDALYVKNSIQKLVNDGKYPLNLWQ
ncbi:MAG: sugar phosphate nucleotidyltransferase [bacterium]|nr:sugar phosphate nucleotidyltransferase [bacterium]